MAVPKSKTDDALLKNLVPLNTLSEDQLGVLLSRVTVEKAKKGEYLFREGDTDHQNVYLLNGTIALLSGQKEMDLVSSGTQTARFALAHQLPRKHSAKARTAVTYVRIDSRMLSDILARSHSASYEVSDIEQPASGDWMSLLLQSPVFQQIPPANLQRVMMRMEEILVNAGDVIIQQGDEGDYFYLISNGECTVTRSPEAGHAPVELAQLRVGKGFGEEALISNKPRGSTVTMLTDGALVRLNKQDFIQLVKQPLSRTISYEQACQEVESGALWLDVRIPEEYEAGHLPGAINLPFFSLRFQASSLAMDRPYVIYGEEVGQSATAAYLLTERGADIFAIDVGWAELVQVSGMDQEAEDEMPVSNVIDFNRDVEDAATQAKQQVDDQRHTIERLQQELAEEKAAHDEEHKQRQTEIKLLKQALAVAKERAAGEAQQTQASEALSQEVERLRELLEHAESQLAAQQRELEQTRTLSDDFRQQSLKLQSQLQESQQRHESQDGRLKEEITELRIQLESAAQAQQELAQKQSALEQLKAERAALEERGEAYRQKSADDLARLTAERFELETALQQMQEKQTAEQADGQQQLVTLQQSLDEARAALEQTQTDLQQRESELQAELDQANQRLSQADEQATGDKLLMQQEIDSLKQSLEEQEYSHQSLQQEKVALQARLQQADGQTNELGNQVQALEERRQSLERELESIRQAGNDAESQHNSAMASLREDLETSRQSVDELRQTRQQLESALQQAQAEFQTQQVQLQEALASANQQASDEQGRLDAVLAELKQALEEAQSEARQQRDKRVELEALLEQEHQTAAFLQRSLKTAEEAVDVSDRQYTETEQKRQALESQLNDLQQLQSEREDERNRLQSDVEGLRQELAAQRGAAETLHSERDAERRSLQAQLSEAQSQAASQAESLANDLTARRQEIEQLREALSAAEAAGEAAADPAELERTRQALSQSEQQIAALKQEIEGLREVQLEMESQLSDDVDQEIQQLRGALEAEEQKRRKAEEKAQKADVLRREREVQETAIEMLHEDLESLDKEKEALAAERDKLAADQEKLAKQLREIRVQYTDLVNENDQLHSEISGFAGHVSDSHLADDLLSQMEELRHKAERYERQRDQANADASRMRREVGELRSVIETYVEQIQDVQAFGADEQVAALRTELDMVRHQAHDDLEQMRLQLREAESRLSGMENRDINDVADQQAIRQEMVSLQQALNEKDHLLRLSQNQCRSLEDAIEDRDKEVDQLKRKLELLLRKTGGLDDPAMRLGSRNLADAQQKPADGLGGDNDSRKSGLGRLFRKK
jgi:CRP-like cAMP-binding protein/chromosome segregation ATPase